MTTDPTPIEPIDPAAYWRARFAEHAAQCPQSLAPAGDVPRRFVDPLASARGGGATLAVLGALVAAVAVTVVRRRPFTRRSDEPEVTP